MKATDSAFDNALHEEMHRKEARSEQISCLIMAFILISLYVIIHLSTRDALSSFQLFGLRITGAITLFCMLIMVVAIQFWRWHPIMKFFNIALQVSAVSAMLVLTTKEQGPTFALTTAAPMVYALIISITAFRLNPYLSFFAGALSAVEFFAVYVFVMRPMLTMEQIISMPTLSYSSMLIRIIVLFAIGFACTLAARSLSSNIVRSVQDAVKVDLLERTFGRYVSPEIARHVLSNDRFLEARKSEGVVMFADLRGFTSYASSRSAEDVSALLNRCWDVAIRIVESHGGVVNKFLGDGFLALFGVPIELPNPEEAAAATAVELQQGLKSILEPEGLDLCIGIHRGEFIAGGVGSESRCEFTVIGTTVNVASRIESCNRELKTQCLASTELVNRIHGTFETQSRGKHSLKGISEPFELHEFSSRKDIPAKPSNSV